MRGARGTSMKGPALNRRLAVLLASASVAAVALPIAQAPATKSPMAHAACTQATIAGAHKCIARGQYCKRTARAMRDYRRYGLSCTKRDSRGRYHLR
jgi:hypothetical protein